MVLDTVASVWSPEKACWKRPSNKMRGFYETRWKTKQDEKHHNRARRQKHHKQAEEHLGTNSSHTGNDFDDFDAACFFAWCSLYQPYHERGCGGTYQRMKNPKLSDAQQLSFQQGLEHMDIWYTHRWTEVWMLTKYFEGQGAKDDDRGWTTWECTVANFLTILNMLQLDEEDELNVSFLCNLCNLSFLRSRSWCCLNPLSLAQELWAWAVHSRRASGLPNKRYR